MAVKAFSNLISLQAVFGVFGETTGASDIFL